MTWHAVFEQSTGRLESVGEVVASDADLAARGLAKKVLIARPDFETEMWDDASQDFIPRPSKVLVDRLQELVNHPKVTSWLSKLNPQERRDLRDVVVALLGRKRWRSPASRFEIGD